MTEFLSKERFKLELRWSNVEYIEDTKCLLKDAYFSGPALQIAQKINNNDHLMLDFYSQYIQLVKGTYVGKFSWREVNYQKDNVFLNNAILEHDTELVTVPILNNNDYFVIDTSDHEISIHSQNLVYKTYVISEENTLYRFEK